MMHDSSPHQIFVCGIPGQSRVKFHTVLEHCHIPLPAGTLGEKRTGWRSVLQKACQAHSSSPLSVMPHSQSGEKKAMGSCRHVDIEVQTSKGSFLCVSFYFFFTERIRERQKWLWGRNPRLFLMASTQIQTLQLHSQMWIILLTCCKTLHILIFVLFLGIYQKHEKIRVQFKCGDCC